MLHSPAILRLAFLLLVGVGCRSSARDAPRVHNGVLDLRSEQWLDGPISLDGEWRHVRGELVPVDVSMDTADLTPVPGAWADDPTWDVPAFGVGTYSLVVRLPEAGGPFTIRTGRTYTASTVFVDGIRVAGSGLVRDQPHGAIPSLEPRIVELPLDRSEIELRVWVSNFHGHQGGLRRSWIVGPSGEIVRVTARAALLATLLSSFLGVVAVLTFLMWLAERRGTDKLWFAAVTLVTSIRSAVGGDAHLVYLLLPRASWADLMRVEFSTDFLAPALALALLAQLFPTYTPRRLANALMVAFSAMAVVCVLLPPYILGQLVPLVLLAVSLAAGVAVFLLVRAAIADAPQARLLIVAVGIVSITAFHDVLTALRVIPGDVEIVGWGFVAMVSAQAYAIARLVADANRRIERLSADITAAHNDLMRTHEAVIRFVPFAFLDLLGRSSILDVKRGDHVAMDVEVLFCDIRGYTTLVEGLTPSDAFGLINEWLGTLEPHVHRAGGFVKEYLGDCIVALFPSGPDDALQACIAMHSALRRFSATQTFAPGRPITAGMGLHAGPLVMGTIGGDTRLDTGAVGDVVNTTSRVEGLTRTYGTDLLITEVVVRRLRRPEAVELRELDEVVVRGRRQPLRIFEVLDALAPEVRALRLRTRPHYAAGREALQCGNPGEARTHFDRCLAIGAEAEDVQLRRVGRTEQLQLLIARGHFEKGRRLADALIRDFRFLGAGSRLAGVLMLAGELHRFVGELDRAEDLYRQTQAIYEELGSPMALLARVNLAIVEFLRGRIDDSFDDLDALHDEALAGQIRWLADPIRLVRAPAAAALGRWDLVDEVLDTLEVQAEQGDRLDLDAVWVARELSRMAPGGGDPARHRRLERLITVVEERFAGSRSEPGRA